MEKCFLLHRCASLFLGLSLTVVLPCWSDSTYAAPSNGHQANIQNDTHKNPHSARKQAAKRLRLVHQQEHQQKLHDWVKSHHGYTGQGQAGDGFDSDQLPSTHGGVK